MSSAAPTQLIDSFGRHINYVRFSVTDRCNLRCVYCMDEGMRFVPRAQLLTLEELAALGRSLVELGVEKIRITGGEPLVRHNLLWLVQELGKLREHGLRELTMTTNGAQLERYAVQLQAAGVTRINISLDSLNPTRFRRITRTGDLAQVLRGIRAAQAAGFQRIKLNAVIISGQNSDEVTDLAQFAIAQGLDISYIEEMPLGALSDHEHTASYYPNTAIYATLNKTLELLPSTEKSGGPARYYRMAGNATRIGFISPHSHNFCADCNRVRISAEGQLLLCLGQEQAVDLRQVLRAYPGDAQRLRETLLAAMHIKPFGHNFAQHTLPLRHMNRTGG